MPNPDSSSDPLDKVYQKVVKTYSHRPNVTGVDVGFRYVDGKRTGDLAVRIHVKEKIPKEALEADELFPEEVDGVPIDVVQAVYKPHAQLAALETEPINRKVRFDPLQPGISVSHEGGPAGTIGVFVYDRQSGRRGILSNWHVLAADESARPGDAIVQPGQRHGGRVPLDQIGTLERFMLDANGDAALALLNASRGTLPLQAESGVEIRAARRVRIGDTVEKSGQTTAVTRGLVEGIGQYTLEYNVGTRTIAGFKVVTEIDGNPDNLEISGGGDSGSVWYAVDDKKGVGLHFAGETDPSPDQEHALACHLPEVLEQLDISLRPVGMVPVPAPEEYPQALATSAASGIDASRLFLETVVRLTQLLEYALAKAELITSKKLEGQSNERRASRNDSENPKRPKVKPR